MDQSGRVIPTVSKFGGKGAKPTGALLRGGIPTGPGAQGAAKNKANGAPMASKSGKSELIAKNNQ